MKTKLSKIENLGHGSSVIFLDALASLERVMFVGGEFFVRYMIKGFTRLRVTDRNRSLIKQDIWSNKTYRRTTIQPYNLKPYKTYNLTNL